METGHPVRIVALEDRRAPGLSADHRTRLARAVPLILCLLAREADFWFEALVAITGEQPVPPEHAGNVEAMRQDWLRWGREHGYDC